MNLHDAIEAWGEYADANPGVTAPIVAAARWVASLTVPCPDCNGEGERWGNAVEYFPCRSCARYGGRGVTPSERLLNIIGKGLYGWGDDEPNRATGAIAVSEVTEVAAALVADLLAATGGTEQ